MDISEGAPRGGSELRAMPAQPASSEIMGELGRETEADYKFVQVSKILKHLDGPDASVTPGQTLLVADHGMSNGDEILDDMEVHPSDGTVLMFLRRAGGTRVVNGRPYPVYVFTSAFNSKYSVDANGQLHALGLRKTSVIRQYSNSTLAAVLNSVRTGTAPSKDVRGLAPGTYDFDEATTMAALFRRNGITGQSGIASYQLSLGNNSHALYLTLAKKDARSAASLSTP